MPYLHWETDRARVKVGDMIERYTRRHNDKEIGKFRDYVHEIRKMQRRKWGQLREPADLAARSRPASKELLTPEEQEREEREKSRYYANAITKNLEDVLWQEVRTAHWKKNEKQQEASKVFTGIRIDEWRRFIPRGPKKALAQYLLDAARLFETMSHYPEFKLFDKYLFANPPVHPRRSLDQSYLWRLNSTRRRDRDQVVYRYTKPRIPHKFQPMPSNSGGLPSRLLEPMGNDCIGNLKEPHPLAWIDHGDAEKDGCYECWEDSLAVARSVMVDQLWMWVLDDDTILTCFPQRYGSGKEDPSEVHNVIARRLTPPGETSIFSAWDLAVIILDACFDSFFDRTITTDRRPQVLDIFSESIGNIVCT